MIACVFSKLSYFSRKLGKLRIKTEECIEHKTAQLIISAVILFDKNGTILWVACLLSSHC